MCFGGGSNLNGERVYLCNGYGQQTKRYHKCDSCGYDRFVIDHVVDGASINESTGVESETVFAKCAKCGASNFIDVID